MIKNFFFDLDGTLLQMDIDRFTKIYFNGIGNLVSKFSFEEFMSYMNAGIKAMYKNDGTKTNEEAFISTFEALSGYNFNEYKDIYDNYYLTNFDECKKACNINGAARLIVDILKEKGYRIFIATNPLFPRVATMKRLEWLGLSIDEFECVTTYENYHYAKPNPMYFKEICDKFNADPKESVMVGNDVLEDGCCKALGMKLILLTDCLLNSKNLPIEADSVITLSEFIEYVKAL